MDSFFIVQIAVGVYLGAVLAGATILGIMKYSADELAGRPTKRHHLYPLILGCAGTVLTLIGSAGP